MLFAVVIASGCSSLPKQTFNTEANQNIRQLTLITPPAVDEVDVFMVNHPAASLGLIGAAIVAADKTLKTKKYNNAIKANKVNWTNYAQQQLQQELKKVGYNVKISAAPPKQKRTQKFLETYADTTADASLDYYFKVAHIAAGPTTKYIPSITLQTRLVSTKNKSVLYAEQFESGYSFQQKNPHIAIGQQFKSATDLTSNPKNSVNALKEGINKIAKMIAQDLKRNAQGNKNALTQK